MRVDDPHIGDARGHEAGEGLGRRQVAGTPQRVRVPLRFIRLCSAVPAKTALVGHDWLPR